MTLKEKIKLAESETEVNPTEAQKLAGNYKKGSFVTQGFRITIENPVGSVRKGKDKNGTEWESETKFTYGYLNSTMGFDGDQVDVYLGPDIDEEFDVYVVDQVDEETRTFDEHKVMFGFKDEESAKQAYLDSFSKDWTGFSHITTFSIQGFKNWLEKTDSIKYPAHRTATRIRMKEKEPVIKSIKLYGVVIEDETLKDLKKQVGKDYFDVLVLEIASPGGSVFEGLSIMSWLDNLSRKGKHVVTVVSANAYSIASLIMLVADERLISKHGEVMVHNPMIPELVYMNADQLEKYASELRELESTMYLLYETFTGLKKDVVKELMDNETYLSPQDAVDNGFADIIVDIKKKSYEMASNNQKKINMHKTMNILNKVIARMNKAEFINQLYYSLAGDKVNIQQKDPSTYAIGDKTDLEEGNIKLSDGAQLTIVNYVIENIDHSAEAANPEGGEFNEGPAPESAISPEATTISEINKWEREVVNDTFEIGTKVEYVPYEDGGEPCTVSSGEYQLEDGRKVLVDSDGIIQFIKPAEGGPMEEPPVEEPPMEEPPVNPEEVLENALEQEAAVEEPPVEPVPTEEPPVEEPPVEPEEDNKKLTEMIDTLNAAVEELSKKVTEMASNQEALSLSIQNFKDFESMATEAIDAIAKNTTSDFKPEATVVEEAPSGGSIFQRMKEKRGLSQK